MLTVARAAVIRLIGHIELRESVPIDFMRTLSNIWEATYVIYVSLDCGFTSLGL